MASAAVAKRRGSATGKMAAKERKQKVFVAVLAVVLAALLLYEVPRTLKLAGKSGSAPAAVGAPISTAAPGHRTRLHGSGNGSDPFALRSVGNGDTPPAGAGGPDPFTAPSASSPAAAAPPAAPPVRVALPQQIVIGRPGGDRVAKHGWIVILASISTRNGHGEAVRFARSARRNVGPLSVLNSSHSRSLRGGYWVVYSGPYATLDKVSKRVSDIHAAGYRTAYLRELIAYR